MQSMLVVGRGDRHLHRLHGRLHGPVAAAVHRLDRRHLRPRWAGRCSRSASWASGSSACSRPSRATGSSCPSSARSPRSRSGRPSACDFRPQRRSHARPRYNAGMFSRSSPVTEAAVLDALRVVQDPDLHKDIVSLGFVKRLAIDGGVVALHHRAHHAGLSGEGSAARSGGGRGPRHRRRHRRRRRDDRQRARRRRCPTAAARRSRASATSSPSAPARAASARPPSR